MQTRPQEDNGNGNARSRQASPLAALPLGARQQDSLPNSPSSGSSPTLKTPSIVRPSSPQVTAHLMSRDHSLNHEDIKTFIRTPSIQSASSGSRPFNNHRSRHNGHARHPSGYSSYSSISEAPIPWTTRDIGFNAISGVLNDPSKRSQNTAKPSKTDVPPVPRTFIDKVKPSSFQSYLAHIQPVFERYQQNKLSADGIVSSALSFGTQNSIPGLLDDPLHENLNRCRNPYSLPTPHVLSNESLSIDGNDQLSMVQRELPMLENVPPIFFDPDFYLENPRTFDAVCEGADIIGRNTPPVSTSTNSFLQEKLSYYLDTVEIHLIEEIENRSSSFFEALSNLQALHQETLDCIAKIHAIRQRMKQIQSTESLDGLEIIRLHVRRRNLQKLQKIVETIKDIRSAQPMIQILLGQGDYLGALDLIDTTMNTLNHNDSNLVDVKAVRALANFSTQLDEMQKAVGIMMQHDFISTLLSDLSYSLETMNMETARANFLIQAELPQAHDDAELKKQLVRSATGLARTNMFSATIQGYRERVLFEIKDIIRKHYPPAETINSPGLTGQSTLAKHLKGMPFNAFFQTLVNVFSVLQTAIQRAASYHQLILSLLDQCTEDPTLNTENHLDQIKRESADVVFAAADLAHVRCAKLIGSRSEQNAQLNLADFFRLTTVTSTFIRHCEDCCGRTCFGLRGTMLSQQKAFIDNFHMERVKQESQLIENEQWAASEVPSDFQRIVDRICDGSISAFAKDDTLHAENSKGSKVLVVHGTSYYVVGCSLLLIKMIEEYLRCILNLESITTDIMQKMVELLKLFNSRVCQVILGAGAMRSAGLKNISAKHLALSSQSIGIMIDLIPSLKDCVGRYMPPKHSVLLSEFDRILKDFTEHQNEIHTKLVAIMNERFAVHTKAMQAIAWDENSGTDKAVNSYMETLVKETMTLRKVLSKYLSHEDLLQIMTRVYQSFTTQLIQDIGRLSIHTERGKKRLSKDTTYFTQKLSSLDDSESLFNTLTEAVENITLEDDTSAT